MPQGVADCGGGGEANRAGCQRLAPALYWLMPRTWETAASRDWRLNRIKRSAGAAAVGTCRVRHLLRGVHPPSSGISPPGAEYVPARTFDQISGRFATSDICRPGANCSKIRFTSVAQS